MAERKQKLVAGRFGLNTSDLECLDLIYLRGHASAGELARATGLTSGAVTALIDRLERAGYVERTDDPTDRRRREVRILADAIEPIQAVYQPMQARMVELRRPRPGGHPRLHLAEHRPGGGVHRGAGPITRPIIRLRARAGPPARHALSFSTPYGSNAGSLVTSVSPSTSACAASNRSKGSR